MNYCSLEDAWGKSDYISNQYKQYDTVENFDQTKINNEVNYAINDNRIPETIIEKPVQNIKLQQNCVFTCDDFINHLNKCQKCRMKIKKQFSSKIVDKIQQIIFYNKDTVLLILMAFFILIFFNLLFSIFRH